MEQFRKFLRDKAFALVLTACLLAAGGPVVDRSDNPSG